MIGGNLIGVGGEVDKPSVKNYMGADRYRYWEFIWSPEKGTKLSLPGAKKTKGKAAAKKPASSAEPGSSAAPPAPGENSPSSGSSSGPSSGNDQPTQPSTGNPFGQN